MWSDKSKIALNGRILLRKPRLYQSCSAEEEEEDDDDYDGDDDARGAGRLAS
jgi:hypothetical protein